MHVGATPVRKRSRASSRRDPEGERYAGHRGPAGQCSRSHEIFDLRVFLVQGELAEAAATRLPEARLAHICDLQEELVAAFGTQATTRRP